MKTKLPTKKCKFIVSVEFDVHEKLNTEDYYFFFKHLIFVLLGFISKTFEFI